MKISELRQLIREEVREAINNENTKLNLKKNGIYILDGGLNNNDTWYIYNDENKIKKFIDIKGIQDNDAYLLFYVKE